MAGLKLQTLLLIATLVLCTNMKPCSGSTTFEADNDQFIQTCCNTTIYQTLCVNSLSSYSTKIKSRYPKLVYTALNLSLQTAKSALSALLKLSTQFNEVACLTDCVENVRESVDVLKMSMDEFENLNATDLDYKMSNIMTWVSAALANDDTCLEGLEEQPVDTMVQDTIRENVVNCRQMTSNALALVSSVDYSQLYKN